MTTGSRPLAEEHHSRVATAPASSSPQPGGLRERKRQRTNSALVRAALELFEDRSYDEVTVAQIAERAGVSTRTFFSYFPSKEDVLFADTSERIEHALRTMGERVSGESPVDMLVRSIRGSLLGSGPPDTAHDHFAELYTLRLHLSHSTPQIQAGIARRLQEAQGVLARSLHEAFPDRVTPLEAAALVGAFIGAAVNAVLLTWQEDTGAPGPSHIASAAIDIVRHQVQELDRVVDPAPSQTPAPQQTRDRPRERHRSSADDPSGDDSDSDMA